MAASLLLAILLTVAGILLYSIEWDHASEPEFYMTEVNIEAPPDFKLPNTAPKSTPQEQEKKVREKAITKKKEDLHVVKDEEMEQSKVERTHAEEKTEMKDSAVSTSTSNSNLSDAGSDLAVDFADVMPQYPGGQMALLRFIQSKLLYPQDAMRLRIEGVVNIGFVVDKYGRVRNPKVLKSLSSSCDAEALRVVRLIPDWIPAKNEGRNVAVQFSLPVEFKLSRN